MIFIRVSLFLTLATLFSCTESLVIQSRDETVPMSPNQAGSDYFPNQVGDFWVYQSNMGFDEITTVTGVGQLSDGKAAMIWQIQLPSGTYSRLVRVSQDTITMLDSNNSSSRIFLLPFERGKTWSDVSTAYQVMSDTPFFRIQRSYISGSGGGTEDYYFSPQVGFVKMVFASSPPPVDFELALKRYQLK